MQDEACRIDWRQRIGRLVSLALVCVPPGFGFLTA